MFDLTRLMYDDGASRKPIENAYAFEADFPGTLTYLGEFKLHGHYWAMYKITSLTRIVHIHGWWVNQNCDWMLTDLERTAGELWYHNQNEMPGWSDGPREVLPTNITQYGTSLIFEEL